MGPYAVPSRMCHFPCSGTPRSLLRCLSGQTATMSSKGDPFTRATSLTAEKEVAVVVMVIGVWNVPSPFPREMLKTPDVVTVTRSSMGLPFGYVSPKMSPMATAALLLPAPAPLSNNEGEPKLSRQRSSRGSSKRPGPSQPSAPARTNQFRDGERMSGIDSCLRGPELACHGRTSAARNRLPPRAASQRDVASLEA